MTSVANRLAAACDQHDGLAELMTDDVMRLLSGAPAIVAVVRAILQKGVFPMRVWRFISDSEFSKVYAYCLSIDLGLRSEDSQMQ
ncbi:hypothetical protein NPX13_g3814 [Xylaria arbuscula]|uniref:Uncharacterized protein n=1 Tax=Xylaria arbuscula TaxID=114810 RepID=A0A9W8NH16_9PEZI|nr:hypothetical protein NPX13_g3814 [Xylaria arbuscula]